MLKRVKDVELLEQQSLPGGVSIKGQSKYGGAKKKPPAHQLMLSIGLVPEMMADDEIDSHMFDRDGDDGSVGQMNQPRLNKR